ncbi:MATE family efflux transporter [Anaerotignum sp.]
MDLLHGDIHKLYHKYLIPAISSSIAVAIYSFVDTIAIGQGVGALGMAACAVVLPIFVIASFIALICGIGGSVLMSQERGRGNQKKGDAYYTAAFLLVLFLMAIAWIAGMVFQVPFYRLCGADDSVLPYALEYGKWIFGFTPTFVLTTFLGCFIRTDGAPKFVMAVTLIGGVINIIGDYVFVFPMKMGMTGAALATVMGSAVQAFLLLGFVFLKKSNLKLRKPERWMSVIHKILTVGFGAGISQIAVILITFIANNQIMRYSGSAALAVYGMLSTVAALYMSLFNGIGQAAQPIVSTNYGSGQRERCWAVGKLGFKTAVLFGVFFVGTSILFPMQITRIFMKVTPEIKQIAPYIMRVYALSFLPQAVNIFVTSYLQSVMHPKMASLIAIARGMILNGIFLFLMPWVMGENGIWWAIPAAEGVTMLIALGYTGYLYQRYKKNG